MRVTIIDCSHEGGRNDINIMSIRLNYCGVCGVRLFYFKVSSDPTADAMFETEIVDID